MNPKSVHPTRTLFTLATTITAFWGFAVLPTRVHASPPQYTVTDLGTSGGTSSEAHGINASGQVVGDRYFPGSNPFAVLWTGTTPTNLGPVGYGINASAQIAGFNPNGGSNARAVRVTGGGAEDLGTTDGIASQGFAINDSGQVAGYSFNAAGNRHAVRWTGTTPTDLGTLGGRLSFGYGINESGQVAGSAQASFSNSSLQAARWTGTTVEALGSLGAESVGYSINSSGQVAGSSGGYAVRWTGTTPTNLGVLGAAYGINAFGDVTGMAGSAAFLYDGEATYDLFTLVLPGSGVTSLTIQQYGNSINDSGQIAATGLIGGQTHALRLDPVAAPEPSSAILLIGSLSLLGLSRQRRI